MAGASRGMLNMGAKTHCTHCININIMLNYYGVEKNLAKIAHAAIIMGVKFSGNFFAL